MKIDLHVHSKYSKRPSEWILQKLGCPESFTDPLHLYRIAKSRGMSAVTITDHNAIDGCLEIAHLPDTFVSEEVTTYFPEDRCKLHVLVFDIDEKKHQEIQSIRENVFDLTAYLRDNGITHVLAHPLFSVNHKLTPDHFEKCLLLFKNFEISGARNEEQNRCLELILSTLTQETIEQLADKHNLVPAFASHWKKNLTGGSDDHSSLTIARRYTEIEGPTAVRGFLRELENHKAVVAGLGCCPKTLAHNVYSIAYQFYQHKFDLGRRASSDIIFKFLDRFLRVDQNREPSLLARLNFFWNHGRKTKPSETGNRSVLNLLREETHRLIWDDPQLSAIFKNGNGDNQNLDQKWFQFVNKISNKVLLPFTDHVIDSLAGAQFLNVFHSLGSAGALYSVLAPYFVAFSIYSEDRNFGKQVLQRFVSKKGECPLAGTEIKVAQFTDTFYEVNGVTRTLRRQIEAARRMNKNYTVIACDSGNHANGPGVKNFNPIGVYELSVYPEQKLLYPPFLEMLDYCYEKKFTHIHSASPGPAGLAALAIARILKLPIVGTYHTALPQYAEYLTEDGAVAEVLWSYVRWYYDQMDVVYAHSKSTAAELADKGISPHKIRIVPRGVDIEMFHPSKRNVNPDKLCAGPGTQKLLYVGRVSKEKNLQILVNVFRLLVQSRQNVTLVIVGDGPYRKEMEQALNGTPSVFMGYMEGEALAEVYASCDLFVFPSTTDTFGNVVLEAQASGLPVIVTDCGGPRENILPGKTGLIVEGNSEKSLLEAIRSLLSDTERLKGMGNAAHEYAKKRSFDRAFRECWELYAQVPGYSGNDGNGTGSAREVGRKSGFFEEMLWQADHRFDEPDGAGIRTKPPAVSAQAEHEIHNWMGLAANEFRSP
jgi:glycosyltransferase involved in cell wall biosynthesis